MTTIVLDTLQYVGSGILNGVSYFWERAGGVVNAFSKLHARIDLSTTKTTVAWKLSIPVTIAADSACGCAGEVARTAIIDVVVRLDRGATAAERLSVYNRTKDLVASTQFAKSITSLEMPL